MRIRSILLMLVLVALGKACPAQTDMRFFVGTWDFRIWGTADISSPPALQGTWHLENGLDSALALVGHVTLNAGPGVLGGEFTRELIAFDAHERQYTRTIVTNTGANYRFNSEGWKGDAITWLGQQRTAAGIVDLREEITRTGQDSFTAIFYRNEGDGWVLQSNERLVRVGR